MVGDEIRKKALELQVGEVSPQFIQSYSVRYVGLVQLTHWGGAMLQGPLVDRTSLVMPARYRRSGDGMEVDPMLTSVKYLSKTPMKWGKGGLDGEFHLESCVTWISYFQGSGSSMRWKHEIYA